MGSMLTQQNLLDLWNQLNAVEELYRNQKALFYRPHAKQRDFHSGQQAYVRVVLGSNRSGKSVAGYLEAYAHALGYRPWLEQDDPDYIVRLPSGQPIPVPNVGRIVSQSFQPAAVQVIWPKVQEWSMAGTYRVKNNAQQVPIKFTFDNGSIVHVMSNEQEDDAFEGPNGHWVWIDEPCDYSKYIGLKRGLVDYGGHMWLTLTPLSQPWIHDVLISRCNEPDGHVRLYKFSVWDNARENGGFLERRDIEEFIRDMREDEMEARLYGNFLHLAGRVFKQWEPEAPFWVQPRRLPETWPRVCVIDPHPRKPIAVLWAALSPDNQLFVYRDLFDERLRTVKEVSDRIKQLEGYRWDNQRRTWVPGETTEVIALRLIDTSANEQERTSGETIMQRFHKEGIYCRGAQKRNYDAGLDAIHEALRIRYQWGEPGLIVFTNCVHTKRNFLMFCWDEYGTSRQKDLKDPKPDVRKKDDDFIDCIRYIYQSGLTYTMLRSNAYDAERQRYAEEESSINGFGLLTGHQYGGKVQWPTSQKSNRPRASSSPGMGSFSTTIGIRRPK